MKLTTPWSDSWPILKQYDARHLARIALPIGGIGTGTVSLCGNGELCDWEIVNRPAKGFTPTAAAAPFFALWVKAPGSPPVTRALLGPVPEQEYEASHGSRAPNHGLPRFSTCAFAAAYPLAQVGLSDPALPVQVRLEAFNPMIPPDADASGIPIAILRYVLMNRTGQPLTVAVCGSIPNFIGMDGSRTEKDWGGQPVVFIGAKRNVNTFKSSGRLRGLFMHSRGVPRRDEAWGTLALTTLSRGHLTYRTAWAKLSWGDTLLDFWDDFTTDGELEERRAEGVDMPMGSLAIKFRLTPHGQRAVVFLLTWHFPNRVTWTPRQCGPAGAAVTERVGNYYATRYRDAWDVAVRTAPQFGSLEAGTVAFVRAVVSSDLPVVVKEAALCTLTALRSQTSFRTADGRFFGWEGCHDRQGCCHGSCTHVWNYEQATAFLYGDLARAMREVEFLHATDRNGRMSFRVHLPLRRAQEFGKAAADGQMGCIMKAYRDWQFCGDDRFLRRIWPAVRRALAFCWVPGGWDADQDGVMEGCQHNTMDVEYYGPNPQMQSWYLGALRAAEEMARYLGDNAFAARCRRLFAQGSAWTDRYLFNGAYYEHEIRAPGPATAIADGLRVGMSPTGPEGPVLQLGPGCLVDQLVGQFMAHICGLGYLLNPRHVRAALRSIMRYNFRREFYGHFNHLRSFALGPEQGLLMATYPRGRRPRRPFPYYNEVMTGFEYTAAVGMIQEGDEAAGLRCFRAVRARFDGRKRNPFNEAECGHHYARAMAAWAAIPALTAFHYSGVTQTLSLRPRPGRWFWSSGNAWGTYQLTVGKRAARVALTAQQGALRLNSLILTGFGQCDLEAPQVLGHGATVTLIVRKALSSHGQDTNPVLQRST